ARVRRDAREDARSLAISSRRRADSQGLDRTRAQSSRFAPLERILRDQPIRHHHQASVVDGETSIENRPRDRTERMHVTGASASHPKLSTRGRPRKGSALAERDVAELVEGRSSRAEAGEHEFPLQAAFAKPKATFEIVDESASLVGISPLHEFSRQI